VLYSTTTEQDIEQVIQSNTQNITQTISSDILIRVEEVNDEVARLAMTYEKLYMNMDMGMMQMVFDTE
jgi:seryl-tRNA(Sec) selenium transferase